MGLFKQFGSWGTRLWEAARATVQPILTALGYAARAEREVEIPDLRREFRKVSRVEGLSAQIGDVTDSEYIPRQLYQTREIPWDKTFAYNVLITGRDLKTGRFSRTARWLTFSREMEVGEIKDAAMVLFSEESEYLPHDIRQMSVVGAEIRAGEWL